MNTQQTNPPNGASGRRQPAGIKETFKEDFQQGNYGRAIKQDVEELYNYYVDDERKERLKNMRWFRRLFYTTLWLGQSLVLKLTPARRLLVVIAIVLAIISPDFSCGAGDTQTRMNLTGLGFVVLLLILALELKDKLLARNELQAGFAVQSALMPQRSPAVAGWDVWLYTRPAREVGGDLVDYIKLSDTRHGVALGDVAGKGLGAALFTVKLQSTLRAFVPNVSSIAELGKKLNEVFYRDKVPNIFASLVYMELDSNSNTVKVLNAGHVLPIVLLPDKGTALEPGAYREIPRSGPGLGILPEAEFTEQLVEIGAEETVVIYSDGVTDARNSRGEFFSTERFLQRLSLLKGLTAQQTGERILRDVDFFAGDTPLYDDLSIVVLRQAAVTS